MILRNVARNNVILRLTPPHFDPLKHKIKKTWCHRFCKRWKISRRRRTNTKKKDLFERLHLIRRYHWWIVYQFSYPKNYPKYFDRKKLPPLPESDDDESSDSSDISCSESVSESSYDSDTDSSETPSNMSDDDNLHSSSEETESKESES